jgi:hypothetical protein
MKGDAEGGSRSCHLPRARHYRPWNAHVAMSSRVLRTSGGVVLAVALTAGVVASAPGQAGRGPDAIVLDVGRPGAPIPPTLFGVFFEDINFAADGGLYPERVINRSFEFTEPLSGWRKPWRPEAEGELVVLAEGGLNEDNPHYLRLRVHTSPTSTPGSGRRLLPLSVNGSEKNAQDGLYTSASVDHGNSELILKAVNSTAAARKVRVEVKGAGAFRGEGRLLVLASADLKAENSLDQPTRLTPVERTVAPSSSGFDLTLEPQSLTVLRAKYSR